MQSPFSVGCPKGRRKISSTEDLLCSFSAILFCHSNEEVFGSSGCARAMWYIYIWGYSFHKRIQTTLNWLNIYIPVQLMWVASSAGPLGNGSRSSCRWRWASVPRRTWCAARARSCRCCGCGVCARIPSPGLCSSSSALPVKARMSDGKTFKKMANNFCENNPNDNNHKGNHGLTTGLQI